MGQNKTNKRKRSIRFFIFLKSKLAPIYYYNSKLHRCSQKKNIKTFFSLSPVQPRLTNAFAFSPFKSVRLVAGW